MTLHKRAISHWPVILLISSVLFTISCNSDEVEIRDPCDFVRSINEIASEPSTSSDDYFVKFSFQENVYYFQKNQIDKSIVTVTIEDNQRSIEVFKNDFFELSFSTPHLARTLFLSLNDQRELLTEEAFLASDPTLLRASFILLDRCGNNYPVLSDDLVTSFSDRSTITVAAIELKGVLPVKGGVYYLADFTVSGTFRAVLEIDNRQSVLGGSFSLPFSTLENF
ncbi:MAG: hypothetical protein ACI8QD_002283 [Cyclobacteriaceae bacterium]|jgi:hypothetical protein